VRRRSLFAFPGLFRRGAPTKTIETTTRGRKETHVAHAGICHRPVHSEKKGVLLVRLWKRYLLVNVPDQEVYDIDPQKIKVMGDSVEWSYADVPDQPIETPDFVERNVGMMERVRFRLGKNGHFLELQIPLGPNGRPIY
jgi:acetyl-CoA carboxylase carboxyltransferase component